MLLKLQLLILTICTALLVLCRPIFFLSLPTAAGAISPDSSCPWFCPSAKIKDVLNLQMGPWHAWWQTMHANLWDWFEHVCTAYYQRLNWAGAVRVGAVAHRLTVYKFCICTPSKSPTEPRQTNPYFTNGDTYSMMSVGDLITKPTHFLCFSPAKTYQRGFPRITLVSNWQGYVTMTDTITLITFDLSLILQNGKKS